MRISSIVTVGAAAATLFASPLAGQQRQSNQEFWGSTWFWGAQGGAFLYSVGGAQQTGVAVGGHWFITSGQSAFNLAFDQLLLPTTNVTVGANQASFTSAQRLSATLYAAPNLSGNMQIFVGGGFAINNLTDAVPTGTFATTAAQAAAQDAIAQVATKAFAILGGGVQYRAMDNWVVFGQYHFMPGTSDFMITSPQHVAQGGIRYALTKSKVVVSTDR